ncbi:MAG: SDR family oxidoreductase [Pseudolabrys sp.]|nr:SDR family oxidoreductase [Pseudolabrys sp.]
MNEGVLTGKVALVTGGASGIGAAIAAELVARGATVAISDIDEGKLEAARAKGLIALRVDNCSVAGIKQAVQALEAQTGGIDILVNNAGISGHSLSLEDVDESGFAAMFDTHVKGAFFFAQAIVPGMKARGAGRIINMSSNFAMTGSPNMSHYVAAKSALLGLTKAWAREFAPHGITVNAVAPGLIATPMTQASLGTEELALRSATIPLGRLAEPREIAYAVAWLAGPEAAMMTGQLISPNGGASIVGI